MEIFSEGVANDATEYNDTEVYGVEGPNSKDYDFWENLIYNNEKGKYDYYKYGQRLISVDIHTNKTVGDEKRQVHRGIKTPLWDVLQKFKRSTHLNYKDLFGTFYLEACSKGYGTEFSPVYKRILDDGTEAYLYRDKLGINWQVIYELKRLWSVLLKCLNE